MGATPITEQTVLRVAVEDPEGKWELRDGRRCAKTYCCAEHNDSSMTLALTTGEQIESRQFRLRINSTHVRCDESNYLLPDLLVEPTELFREKRGSGAEPEVYDAGLPLLADIWTLPIGSNDEYLDDKLSSYRDLGGREIYRLHPFERTLTAWRRQPDGTYLVDVYKGGVARVMSLPDVVVELDELFDFS